MQTYNTTAASATLQELALDVGDNTTLPIHHLAPADVRGKFAVQAVTPPRSWVLMTRSDRDAPGLSEAVFTLRGMLLSKNLPPFLREEIPRGPQRARFLRLQVEICGLNLPYFETAVGNIQKFYSAFERHFPEHQLERWQPRLSSAGLSVYAGNRIFTPDRETDNALEIPIPEAWDPSSGLSNLVGRGLLFTEDNLVLFYERNSSFEFVEASPVLFRIGDLVEAQISLTVIPIGGRKFRLMTILRSLALLSDTYSKDAQIQREFVDREITGLVRAKRRIGYAAKERTGHAAAGNIGDDDGCEEGEHRVTRMRVDEV